MNNIEYIDIKEKIKLEYYYGDNKHIGEKIIKNNDMLQYHYFSQEYNVVKTSQILCIITLEHHNIKTYIGFIALNPPTLNKTYRNMYYGKNFLKKIYEIRKENKKYSEVKILNISRLVFIPSFRGLGVAKYVQDTMMDDMFNNRIEAFEDVVYLEISSLMLHTFDFSGDRFNKTFLNLKKIYDKEKYFDFFKPLDLKDKSGVKGFKEDTSYIANTAFRFNENYRELFEIYLKDYFDIEITDEQWEKLFDVVEDVFLDDEKFADYRKRDIPLMLTNIMTDEQLKSVETKGIKGILGDDYVPEDKKVNLGEWI